MLRIDTWLTWPGSVCASHQTNWVVTGCLQFSSPHYQAYFLFSCGVLAKPDWTEARTSRKAEPPSCCVAQLKALISVCICCSVCFPSMTAELPPIVLYSSLPLRKLLQCLWMLCNDECVFVDAGLYQIQHPPEQPLIHLFLFFFLYLLFAAQSRSVSDVRHWWMLSLSDLADNVSSEMTRCIISRPPCPELSFLQFSYTLKCTFSLPNNTVIHLIEYWLWYFCVKSSNNVWELLF